MIAKPQLLFLPRQHKTALDSKTALDPCDCRVCTPGHLTSWDKYRELELQLKQNAVTEAGDLLEYETLELRIHPPNVRIDNESNEDKTVLIIDSANRPGTLVEVGALFACAPSSVLPGLGTYQAVDLGCTRLLKVLDYGMLHTSAGWLQLTLEQGRCLPV